MSRTQEATKREQLEEEQKKKQAEAHWNLDFIDREELTKRWVLFTKQLVTLSTLGLVHAYGPGRPKLLEFDGPSSRRHLIYPYV